MEILSLLSNLNAGIDGFITMHGNLIYLLLFAIVFLEIGIFPLFFLPGNPLIFIAGSLCKLGALNLELTLITLTSAIILGNLVSYQIGKIFGHKISNSQSPWASKQALKKTKKFYHKYGQLTLMISPFVAMIRTFAPLLAGVSEMSYKKYLISSTIGAVLWVGILVTAGYYLSSHPFIKEHMASIILAGLTVGIGFVIYGFMVRLKNKRKLS